MNILIVGLGSIARKHIEALKKLNIDCFLYALRSSSNALEEEGIRNIYTLKEIENIKMSFAIVSNPTSSHKKTISDLLSLSCPLFIEKPLYHELDLDDVLLQISKQNILTYVACNLRFLDSFSFLKKKIEESELRLNEVNVYCGSYLPTWRNVDYKKSYSSVPSLGGGVHIDLIHELDYIYWIFGIPNNIQSVFRNVSSLNIETYDYANYNLIYDQFCANVTLNYYRRDYKRTFELVFEDETWLLNLVNNKVTSGEKIIFESDQRIIDTYTAQMDYFIELIKSGNKTSINTVSEAYEILKICLNE